MFFVKKLPKKLESSQNADRQKGEQGQTLLAVDDLRELDVLILLVGIDDHLAAAILGHLYVDDGTDEFGKTVRGTRIVFLTLHIAVVVDNDLFEERVDLALAPFEATLIGRDYIELFGKKFSNWPGCQSTAE